MGTCVLAGECKAAGGVSTGSCNSITRQAICCVCKCIFTFKFEVYVCKRDILYFVYLSDQQSCAGTTSSNNTYFVTPNYPASWSGGSS